MKHFKLELAQQLEIRGCAAKLFKLGWGDPASNDVIVKEVDDHFKEVGLEPGGVAFLNGPCSLVVAGAIIHYFAHRFQAVGIFDPKLGAKGGYVISITHNAAFAVGDVIEV